MRKNLKNGIGFLTHSAIIASSYVALTLAFAFCSSGVIQVRVAEALCVLPYFTKAAIPGLTLGCLIANLLTGSMPWDVVFGTIATLIGAVLTHLISYLPKKFRFASCIPPIISNALIIPQVLKRVYNAPDALPFLVMTVGIGEIISVGILGTLLFLLLYRKRDKFFGNSD